MSQYKLFKKSNSFLKFLTPLNDSNTLRVAKLITPDTVIQGDSDRDEDGNSPPEMYIEIAQCPRIYVGMEINCKNVETGKYEEIGKLIDIQYDDSVGYLFIF